MTWTNFLNSSAPADHGVQIYGELDELAQSVACFVDAGLAHGAPAVLIARSEHERRFVDELETRGHDTQTLERDGLLTYRDADETLAAFMASGFPDADRFEQVVGGLFDEIAARFPRKPIHAFGEMVDILWRDGREQAAIALEALWNELARSRSFALLCGYRLDVFDADFQSRALPKILELHTHARTIGEPALLAAALDRALSDVVGANEAARIYLDVAEQMPSTPLSRGQAVLAWLSNRDAVSAQAVLDRARSNYERHSPRLPSV